ncbi:MAG: uracil phosphoribosyltransferase [Bacteroidetes bacterium]|nr:uracil phosphoribosyltransferase [Bacteroidota bacterium]
MFILSEQPSVANQFLAELRDVHTQQDSMRFRKNLERLGELLAYEVSKTLTYRSIEVQTPLERAQMEVPADQVVLVAVLRAALPFYQGFLNIFDQSESGFIGAFRQENGEKIGVNLGYHASPKLDNKVLILVDPMLATGQSCVTSLKTLLEHGAPKAIHIVAAFAAPEGVQYLATTLEVPYILWLGALDEKLNSKAYIVPGLGDAGDLAFGEKL